jgi:hypothetical protein
MSILHYSPSLVAPFLFYSVSLDFRVFGWLPAAAAAAATAANGNDPRKRDFSD